MVYFIVRRRLSKLLEQRWFHRQAFPRLGYTCVQLHSLKEKTKHLLS